MDKVSESEESNSTHSGKVLLVLFVIAVLAIWPYYAWQHHNNLANSQKLAAASGNVSKSVKSQLDTAVINEAATKGVKAGIQVNIKVLHYTGSEAMGVITFSQAYPPVQFIASNQSGKWVVIKYAPHVTV